MVYHNYLEHALSSSSQSPVIEPSNSLPTISNVEKKLKETLQYLGQGEELVLIYGKSPLTISSDLRRRDDYPIAWGFDAYEDRRGDLHSLYALKVTNESKGDLLNIIKEKAPGFETYAINRKPENLENSSFEEILRETGTG